MEQYLIYACTLIVSLVSAIVWVQWKKLEKLELESADQNGRLPVLEEIPAVDPIENARTLSRIESLLSRLVKDVEVIMEKQNVKA